MTYELNVELTEKVLAEILTERRRQVELWGDQAALRNGTGPTIDLFGWPPARLAEMTTPVAISMIMLRRRRVLGAAVSGVARIP